MLPVLGGEVEERQQHVGVLLQRHQGLRVLRTILDREPPDGLAHLRVGLGVNHLAQRGLHAQLEALRELIEDVAELVEPVALLAGPRPDARLLGGGAGCSVPSRTTNSWVKSG